MKISLNWLKKYLDYKLSTDELVERLTMAGLEIESIETVNEDTVLEIEITPNRPDCLNILGIAREIGAITGEKVNWPKIKEYKISSQKDLIQIEDKQDCARYVATLIKDVRIQDAPIAVKEHLKALGINTINNAVDITNFVLMEMGQPLHVFDYDKLAGGKISVRRARSGEKITTLDGVERQLDPSILVIADSEKPVAIAGIMGGRDSQITASTKNILLESAHFEMGIIRRACRSLGLRSDAAYRFERNVNIESVLDGANRATDLLIELTGGRAVVQNEIISKSSKASIKINMQIDEIENVLGLQISAAKVKTWLMSLGFKVAIKAKSLLVEVPHHRADVKESVDVIEEIARMIGFDNIPSEMPVIKAINIPVDLKPRRIKESIRNSMVGCGLSEIVSLSMINTKALVKTDADQMEALRIFNPLSQDQEILRPVLLPSFLQIVTTNFNRGQRDLRLFEIGKAYFKDHEKELLGILVTGRRSFDWRYSKKDQLDHVDLKGIVQEVLQKIGVEAVYQKASMSGFDPACTAAISIKGQQMGVLGRVSRKVLKQWDIKNQDVYFAALRINNLIDQSQLLKRYQPIAEYPAIVRDVSLAIKKEITYQSIEKICVEEGGSILKSVQFIEQYLGDKIQEGYKGIVFSCQYQSLERTLREEEVTAVHARILEVITNKLGAIRR